MKNSARESILSRLVEDLVGPHDEEEILEGRPSDTYITGILWPMQTQMLPDEDEKISSNSSLNGDEPLSGEEEEVSFRALIKPSVAGLSFAISSVELTLSLSLSVSFGIYRPFHESIPEGADRKCSMKKNFNTSLWKRSVYNISDIICEICPGTRNIDLDTFGVPSGVCLNIRTVPWEEGKLLVTVTLLNKQNEGNFMNRESTEKLTLFQTRVEIKPRGSTRLIARPSRRPIVDENDMSSALLYRHVLEYAVGHTCSASWTESDEPGIASSVFTEWVPRANVRSIDPNGHDYFRDLNTLGDIDPLSADWLSRADDNQLTKALEMVPSIYGKWIEEQKGKIEEVPEEFKNQAYNNLSGCKEAQERMLNGVESIAIDSSKAKAFRFANAAISLQNSWDEKKSTRGSFRWRPFQIGFLLIAANSAIDPSDAYRDTMDLLWFPTGGGKTEAYLGLIAYLLFYRRFSSRPDDQAKPRVNAIMRYTLRTLTTQQFDRAACLIFACEVIRRNEISETAPLGLGTEPFSIGLWVGCEATPNRFEDVPVNPMTATEKTPAQLVYCPACHHKIYWERVVEKGSVEARCRNSKCPLFHDSQPLPIWTVDEDIYRCKPSLVIGTVDKFAQITRNPKIKDFFGIGDCPPDLIIQDELHLISGPLGTIAGLYEVAIDRLFSCAFHKPKIIGSTATIRRAGDQVRALFDRRTCQFPPPALDADDSGFAVTDLNAPGRLYASVTTAGRSAKFTLQAVASSLLQSAKFGISDTETRDPYSTLVSYFNSRRELGGALVMMQDDVRKSMEIFGKIRREETRSVNLVEEMTSRRNQTEIRDLLQSLGVTCDHDGCVDVLLATNMLSVGVDIPRLGLMLVNGQPKGISEYIQATSRVGRGNVPGLIISVLNNVKARDRSHYESFVTWHSSLYRDVEVSSVTPFASRARDKALHAALVALVRCLVPGMLEKPDPKLLQGQILEDIVTYIVGRASSVDPKETAIESELRNLIVRWKQMNPRHYWNPRNRQDSLLQDAEKAAEELAAGNLVSAAWPTPNTMRSVEPSTKFFLRG